MGIAIPFDNSYARLPQGFHARVPPKRLAAPRIVKVNRALAAELGLDASALESPEAAAVLSGGAAAPGSEPIALVYAGHQFGQFVPRLGDGRALLLGEVVDRAGARRDIQLKGSGVTPYSRQGDGLAALGPVLREYLVSEAMNALGVPTTRSLAIVATGESVYRETELPGAVLTRVAASHIRVGTFQYFAARGETDNLRVLADHAITRHQPDAVGEPDRYRRLLEGVARRQAALIARWMLLGFVHGVMNTDNMAVSGETIDYGPCAFLDRYDPATVFSSIDRGGRYAYGNQPAIGQWNLARLAECLLPLLSAVEAEAMEQATGALSLYADEFNTAYRAGLRAKIGLTEGTDEDTALAEDLLRRMQEGGADFTATFRGLSVLAGGGDTSAISSGFRDAAAFDAWAQDWQARLARDGADRRASTDAIRRANPAFIPRNQRVEEVIAAAVSDCDFAPFEAFLQVLSRPYDDQPDAGRWADPGPPAPYRTFCGT
ncbi:YdiU family protein [Aureimonas flava]|uniref:Protein nucleotidyltransferase YdiU n=1 Tax=Aureimonas flava TaxID=2320271 RepID=A0A3A1WMP1_9HYPH|nr:YdiU family protein [Aureimonas flava]RIY01854.1 YdiU family protein [Aureimonas flava]